MRFGSLVVTRKLGEAVMIGEDIEVTVLAARGGRAKLRFTAPTHVPVHRLEIWRRILAERQPGSSPAEGAGSGKRGRERPRKEAA